MPATRRAAGAVRSAARQVVRASRSVIAAARRTSARFEATPIRRFARAPDLSSPCHVGSAVAWRVLEVRGQRRHLDVELVLQRVRFRDHLPEEPLRSEVVGAVHDQDRGSSASMREPCASIHPCNRSSNPFASSGRTAPLPYPVGQVLRPHRASVRARPPERRAIDRAGHAAPDDRVVEAELAQDLWHLRDVAEHVGQVARPHRAPEACGAVEAELQVPDDRLARDEELVHEDVPRPHGDAAAGGEAAETAPRLRDGPRGSRRPRPSARRAGSARTTGSASSRGRRSSSRSTSRSRKVWNGEYHSRSQCV